MAERNAWESRRKLKVSLRGWQEKAHVSEYRLIVQEDCFHSMYSSSKKWTSINRKLGHETGRAEKVELFTDKLNNNAVDDLWHAN